MSIIGTAGHVDHGKSTLIEKLTGIDPDRLLEEKQRGLTIDLGFAWLKDENNNEISFVDVPGHEKFVSNMLTGISGIDMVLMVIAADESIMPQTIEHLQIINLLSIKKAIIAITKTDLVEKEFISLVKDEICNLISGTSIENSPIIETSVNSDIGIQELKKQIFKIIKTVPKKSNIHRPRLPIDRSFSLTGFGTIATGTLLDGEISVGQEIIIFPEKYSIVNLHFGTTQASSKIRLLDRNVLYKNSSCFAQLKLTNPVVFSKNDPFIIRLGNHTIGGGKIIDPNPPRHKKNSQKILQRLGNLSSNSNEKVVLEIIEKYIVLPTKSISKIGNISIEDTTREIKKLLESKKISKLTKNTLDQEKYYITTEREKILTNKIIRFLKDFHLINPLQKGASKEHISSLTNINSEIFSILINNLIESGELVQKHSLIKLKSHSPRLSESQNFEVNKYIKILESNSYAPPTNHTIEKDIINFLIEKNKVMKISDNIIYSITTYNEMLSKIKIALQRNDIFKVDDFKKLFNTTRKYTIPFLEHLDESLITRRYKDGRIKFDQDD